MLSDGIRPERKRPGAAGPFESIEALRLSKPDDGVRERTAPGTNLSVEVGRDRRREPRFVTDGSALLQILNPFSDQYWHVRVLDVSKNGMELCMPTGVMPGSNVKVKMEDCVAFGKTRYCALTTEGFLVGVQIDDHIEYRIALDGIRTADILGGMELV
jgi:hypothetical protein